MTEPAGKPVHVNDPETARETVRLQLGHVGAVGILAVFGAFGYVGALLLSLDLFGLDAGTSNGDMVRIGTFLAVQVFIAVWLLTIAWVVVRMARKRPSWTVAAIGAGFGLGIHLVGQTLVLVAGGAGVS